MEGICLEALISGVLSKDKIITISDETQIVYSNEKPIVINDKYTLVKCSELQRFDIRQDSRSKLNRISEIETKLKNKRLLK